jgi:hypothetical protein
MSRGPDVQDKLEPDFWNAFVLEHVTLVTPSGSARHRQFQMRALQFSFSLLGAHGQGRSPHHAPTAPEGKTWVTRAAGRNRVGWRMRSRRPMRRPRPNDASRGITAVPPSTRNGRRLSP